MKKKNLVVLLLSVAAMTCGSAAVYAEGTEASADGADISVEETDASAEEAVSSVTGYALYDEILQKYLSVMNSSEDFEFYQENDLCYLAGYLSSTDEIGYYITDLNGDGVMELLIGEVNEEEYYDTGMFYDLYTIEDGGRILVATSMERSRYYLCTDGTIAYEGSSSAFCSANGYYRFTGSELELIEGVLYDEEYNSENPWFYSTIDLWEDYGNPVSDTEAVELISSYEYMEIPFITLSEAAGALDGAVSADSSGGMGTTDMTGAAAAGGSGSTAAGEVSALRTQAEDEVEAVEAEAAEIEEILAGSALSQLELNQYSYQLYQLWDDVLNVLWGYLRESLPEEEMSALTEEELAWIDEKEQEIEAAGAEFEGGSMQPYLENTTGAALTKERVYILLDKIP